MINTGPRNSASLGRPNLLLCIEFHFIYPSSPRQPPRFAYLLLTSRAALCFFSPYPLLPGLFQLLTYFSRILLTSPRSFSTLLCARNFFLFVFRARYRKIEEKKFHQLFLSSPLIFFGNKTLYNSYIPRNFALNFKQEEFSYHQQCNKFKDVFTSVCAASITSCSLPPPPIFSSFLAPRRERFFVLLSFRSSTSPFYTLFLLFTISRG